jgi:hypothetical protein
MTNSIARTNRTPKKDPQPDWALNFLTHLRFRGSISAAAIATKVGRRTVYDLRERDASFDKQVREIGEECVENVQSTLYQRAVSGASDAAIIFFLKTHKPEVYGDKLRAEQIEQIRLEARSQVLAELNAELAELEPAARKMLIAAIPRST